jgi:ATP-binding cassette, subfamily C, bacterial CydC
VTTQPNHPVWTLLEKLAAYRGRLIVTTLTGLLAEACAVSAACAAAWLVGSAITGSPLGDLTVGFVVLGGCAAGHGVLEWVRDWASHDYAFRVITELRLWLFAGLERLAPGHLLKRRTGDLAATVIGDLERLEWLYAHIVPGAVTGVVIPGAALIALTTLSPALGLVLLVLTLLLASVPAWLGHRAGTQGRLLREELGGLHADVVDGVQGLRDLVSFGYGKHFLARLTDRMRSLRHAHLAYGHRTGLEGAAADLLVTLALAVTLAATGFLMTAGDLAPRYLAVVLILVGAVLTPVLKVVGALAALGEVRGCASRVLSVVEAEPLVVDRPAARAVPATQLEPHVHFEAVTFGYEGDREPVLREVSFGIEPGEVVALVGSSGAGKSTCVNLLMRFWDVDAGRITVGGVDVRDLTVESLRDAVALVPQDTYLFRTSVRDNIRLARPAASDEEIRHAARRARAADFIEALPDGYDTIVSERGLSLSGGQRQRIAIARAFLKDAPVIVLDEASSSVDAENELLVRGALEDLRRDRAMLVIAHRLGTVRDVDKIIVLQGGRVMERGTHRQLMAEHGHYAQLINAQHSIEI